MYLFAEFSRKHAVKDNFRKSVNDMMILATARSSGERLISKDNLLNRFAAEVFGVHWTEAGPDLIQIDFGSAGPQRGQRFAEGKGYINRGWRIAEEAKRNTV